MAAAVGAVQARANIRMRRLPDSGEDIPECKEALARMRREYVPPTQADVLWADAVIIGLNGKIAGYAVDASEATSLGRETALSLRELRERAGRSAV